MIFPHVEYQTYKDTCRKSFEMRPLSDRKSCEQHLVAHFQWQFLRLLIEFLEEMECKNSIQILRNRH